MRMFSSSANCARMPPADLLVDPEASASRSSRTTSCTPSRRRWKAVAAPRAPPPMTTASAVSADLFVQLSERDEVARGATGPLVQDLLLGREVVLRRRVELDPRIEERIGHVRHALQRLDEPGASRVLAGVLKRVHERPCCAEAVDDVGVAAIQAR